MGLERKFLYTGAAIGAALLVLAGAFLLPPKSESTDVSFSLGRAVKLNQATDQQWQEFNGIMLAALRECLRSEGLKFYLATAHNPDAIELDEERTQLRNNDPIEERETSSQRSGDVAVWGLNAYGQRVLARRHLVIEASLRGSGDSFAWECRYSDMGDTGTGEY